MNEATMSYDEAVAYVREHQRDTHAAWGLVPKLRGGVVVGGGIYVVHNHEPENEDDLDFWVSYANSDDEYDGVSPDDLPTEARNLRYTAITHYESGDMEYEHPVLLKLLQGVPREDALADE